jgi:uncharacterized RDD family membrane protein YckC
LAKRPAPAAVLSAPPPARIRELITPEGVDLRLQLAEASERAAAFLLDVAIMIGVLIVFTIVVILCAIAAGLAGGVSDEVLAILWLAGFFMLRNFYFTLFELTPRAATPGKRIMGLRVASRNGAALTADAIFGRNAMRELEVFLPATFLFANAKDVDALLSTLGIIWTGVFVLFPLFNRDRLRVGDIVAGTWVVKTPRRRLLRDIAEGGYEPNQSFAFSHDQVEAYGIKELHVLEEVLRRYEAKTIAAVAARIRGKIGWTRGPDEGDGDFLEAYYRALRGRLESRLLFGRRRRDKFDKG